MVDWPYIPGGAALDTGMAAPAPSLTARRGWPWCGIARPPRPRDPMLTVAMLADAGAVPGPVATVRGAKAGESASNASDRRSPPTADGPLRPPLRPPDDGTPKPRPSLLLPVPPAADDHGLLLGGGRPTPTPRPSPPTWRPPDSDEEGAAGVGADPPNRPPNMKALDDVDAGALLAVDGAAAPTPRPKPRAPPAPVPPTPPFVAPAAALEGAMEGGWDSEPPNRPPSGAPPMRDEPDGAWGAAATPRKPPPMPRELPFSDERPPPTAVPPTAREPTVELGGDRRADGPDGACVVAMRPALELGPGAVSRLGVSRWDEAGPPSPKKRGPATALGPWPGAGSAPTLTLRRMSTDRPKGSYPPAPEGRSDAAKSGMGAGGEAAGARSAARVLPAAAPGDRPGGELPWLPGAALGPELVVVARELPMTPPPMTPAPGGDCDDGG